mmetsp:Transcript_3760/g.12938  ORF Transcript_3760/g.12938 Transcript_3760/m.12938 type:complete len:95 (+) Transcript_3760:129-413(+)
MTCCCCCCCCTDHDPSALLRLQALLNRLRVVLVHAEHLHEHPPARTGAAPLLPPPTPPQLVLGRYPFRQGGCRCPARARRAEAAARAAEELRQG